MVKYQQGQAGTAALISEVICHALMEAGGLNTLSAAIVVVSERFAASCHGTVEAYDVLAGPHFGTVLRTDVDAGPPDDMDELADPAQLIDIWVFDSWLMNIDRGVYGNILMAPGPGGKWDLIPADQSDCFGGAKELARGAYVRLAGTRGAAGSCPLLGPVQLACGAPAVRSACDRVRTTRAYLPAACERVPGTWWRDSGVEPGNLVECLTERAGRIEDIVDVEKWEELPDATEGGRVLGI